MAKKNTIYGDLFAHQTSGEEVVEYNEPIPTGSLIFDIFLDGGYRCGFSRFGAPSEHGKTAQALCWAREWMKKFKDKAEIYIFDAEGRLTYDKVKESGLMELPEFQWAGKGEIASFNHFVYNVYDDIGEFIKDRVKGNQELKPAERKRFFFLVDSLDMLITKNNLEKSLSDSEKIGAAQVMSAVIIKQVGLYMAKYGHHFHVLSQIRANINTNNANSPQTKISGGNAMLHASSLTADIMKDWSQMYIYKNPNATTLKEKGDVIGKYHTLKFTKTFNNKTHQIIRIPIKYGHGIWREREVADLLLAWGIVSKAGAWFSISDQWKEDISNDLEIEENWGKWQGYENFLSSIEQNPKICNWFDSKLRETLVNYLGERSEDPEGDDEA